MLLMCTVIKTDRQINRIVASVLSQHMQAGGQIRKTSSVEYDRKEDNEKTIKEVCSLAENEEHQSKR